MLNDSFGANFTFATLAVLMKYPWSSEGVNTDRKKYGYFQSEKEIVENIREKTGLSEEIRHPLTYLLEAADDITYIGDDIEDGVKKHLIRWDIAYKDFCEEFEQDKEIKENIIDKIKRIEDKRETDIPEVEIANSRNFRNLLQGWLIRKAKEEFMKNYTVIMNRKMEVDLFEGNSSIKRIITWYKSLMKDNCYSCDEILNLELSAKEVIGTMLDRYISIVNMSESEMDDITNYSNRLLKTISDNYKYVILHDNNSDGKFCNLSKYAKIQLCVDYIAGMTDSYAVRQYRNIMGIGLSLKGY